MALNAHGGSGRLDEESETLIAFNARMDPVHGDIPGALDSDGSTQAVTFDLRGRDGGSIPEGPHPTANIRAASGGSSRSYVVSFGVRRLTPTECERLQGFPDGHTLVPYRGKPAADGPRHKAIGNSMAVPCMRWIGERIQTVDLLSPSEYTAPTTLGTP